MKTVFLAFAALLLPASASAQGVVTSADPRATEAGQEILRAGGTATDAALAMMLALTVVEPQSSGIGGGGFLIHYDAKAKRTQTIDGREKAPATATPDRLLGPDGKPKPFVQLFPGGKSVGVPGNLRLAAMAHQKWGKLPWKALFAPAIRLAEGGFQVTRPLAASSAMVSPLWFGQRVGASTPTNPEAQPIAGDDATRVEATSAVFPDVATLYAPGGKPLTEGATVRNPALAATLRTIAEEGADAFYRGPNAQRLIDTVTQSKVAPSDMTLADLAAYEAKERAPVCATYRIYKLCGMGPPSSGATTVFQILGMLERFDMKKLGKGSPVAWHLISEAMLLAYADREKYLGDADFVSVPVQGLLDRRYVASRSALISPNKSLGTYEAGTPPGAEPRTAAVQDEVPGTTHFVAVDKAGDVVTMTSTVEGPFGSQLVAGGYVLNNELTDFTAAPERNGAPVANRVQGGKRPLSSMSPTIVYDRAGKPIFAVGAAGGKTIIMQVAKAIIAHLDWGETARDAIGEGLVYFRGTTLILEQGTGREALKPALEALGHQVTVGKLGLKANAAEKTKAGWRGAADPRSVGTALNE
jgi:gamma-glutamyltranspeptidase/glutathione hydrolase